VYDIIYEFEIPIYNLEGIIKGNLRGALDSLNAKVSLDVANIHYDSIRVKELRSNFQIYLFDSLYNGFVNLDANAINYNTLAFNSVKLSSSFSNNLINTKIDLNVSDSLSVNYLGKIDGFDNPKITVHSLNISYLNNEWKSVHDSIYIQLNPEFIYINRFYMNSGKQNLKVHGYFTFEGEENLEIQIEKFNLLQIPFNKFWDYPVSDLFNSAFKLSGTSEKPVIKGNVRVNNLEVNNYPTESLTAKISYENNLITYDGIINSALHRYIKTIAHIPLHLSFEEERYLLKDDPDFNSTVSFNSLDEKKLYSFFPIYVI